MLVKANHGWNLLSIFVSGACIGILAGLSLSPVVHDLLSTLAALVVGATGALAGLEIEPAAPSKDTDAAAPSKDTDAAAPIPRRAHRVVAVNPLPIACLLVGIVLGAAVGVLTRTHNLLGVPPLPDPTAAKSEPVHTPAQTTPQSDSPDLHHPSAYDEIQAARLGVLHRAPTEACAEWRATPPQNRKDAMTHSPYAAQYPLLLKQVNGCTDTACLDGVIESLCGK